MARCTSLTGRETNSLRGVAGRLPAFVMLGAGACGVAMGGSRGCGVIARQGDGLQGGAWGGRDECGGHVGPGLGSAVLTSLGRVIHLRLIAPATARWTAGRR